MPRPRPTIFLSILTPIVVPILVMAAAGCDQGDPADPARSARLAPLGATPGASLQDGLSLLLFSRTEGFRHGSIDQAIPALEDLGTEQGWRVDATEDPQEFSLANLDNYDVVVFLNTTGDVLDQGQQQAFEDYIAQGRGYVGIHSATDTEYDWAWYGEMLGGYFDGHPAVQEATIDVVDGAHPSTEHLGDQWVRNDEWYNFSPNPSDTDSIQVLLRLDESTYNGGSMGDDHPIAWIHEYGGGRAFYTGGGHTGASFSEPDFLDHLAGGILWAAGGPEPGGTSSGGADSTGDPPPPSSSDEGGVPTSGGAGSSGAPGTSGSPPPASSTSGQGSGSTGGDPGNADDGGGGCRSGGRGTGPGGLLVLLMAGWARRRRGY